MMKYDFLFKDGRIVDPANNKDFIGDVAIKGDKIAEVSKEINNYLAEQVINISGKVIIPGIIDTHCHIARPAAKGAGYRMLIDTGVTTAFDFEGPIEVIKQEIVKYGCGLNVAVLEAIYPENGIKSKNPPIEELKKIINKNLDSGAIGIKILGGHYPLTPEATYNIFQITHQEKGYMGFHVGTTETGSNIQGVEEAVKLTKGKPLHVAHVNAYCRGYIEDPLLELKIIMDILKKSPNIISESHLALHNGCYGGIDKNGVPISYVLRNSLKANGYKVSKEGLEEALRVKYAGAYALRGSKMKYIYGDEAINYWKEHKYKVGICFPINRRRSAQVCATERDKKGNFVIDAISSDGGVIPRNCILSHGLPLVRFCALTLSELVQKISLTPSRMLGLKNKGHLSIGADADITIFDPDDAKVEIVLIKGKACMVSGIIFNNPGTLIVTQRGANRFKKQEIPLEVINLEDSLFLKGKGGEDK
ncbi:amidohydrolase [Candidatus Atribacteria bacterium 1244-E10-H5-B2]|nr:MAG: amidohydrolase [Candidatus Atribacteria bacterium 1244-E10-H5-B2]